MDKTITIRMTEEQARVISLALEMFTRMGLHQFGYLFETFTYDQLRKNGSSFHKELESVRPLVDNIKAILGFEPNASFGIGSHELHDNVQDAYEIMKIINRELAIRRDPNPKHHDVNYNGVVVKYSRQPLIEIIDSVETNDT